MNGKQQSKELIPVVGMRVRIKDDDHLGPGTIGFIFTTGKKVSVIWDDGVTDNWEPECLVEIEP